MNQQVKAVFSSRPMISFLGSRKLSSYLVRVKLYPLERVVGSCRCNANKCQVCSNITESDELSEQLIIRPIRQIISLTVMKSVLLIDLLARFALSNMIVSEIGGIIKKVATENMSEVSPVTNDTYLSILIVKGTK